MRTSRFSLAIFSSLLLLPALGAVASTSPSTAAPPDAKPTAFTATAAADILSVNADLPAAGSPANVVVGRSSGAVDPTLAAGNVRATSANLDAQLLMGQLSLPIDRITATAAPKSGPTSRNLLPVPANPLVTPALLTGIGYIVCSAWSEAASWWA